jgi:hypothetical protein
MRRLLSIIIYTLSQQVFSQVAIGKTSVSNNSVSLEFGAENRGLILPYNIDKTSIETDGTLIYDTVDYKVKYLKNGIWTDLSKDDGTTTTIGIANLSIQGNDKTEQPNAKTIIGDDISNNTSGVLILSDSTKAMILPKVASPHLNIINPAAGMLVYDTAAKQVAVFNGTSWSFWKP